MAANDPIDPNKSTLEGGTYELLRKRILNSSNSLQAKLEVLNDERKRVFGTIETKVLATERITTSNNCIPWDMHSFGNKFLFGYNVHVGLKSEISIKDVFSFYEYRDDHTFHELEIMASFNDKVFLDDFAQLYKYYKNAHFLRFIDVGPYFHMVFRIGKDVDDIKSFKWEFRNEKFHYIDNRSDHEYKFPEQHQFKWKKTKREDFRDGMYPHISIKDRVFVECVGGDLTIKIEDNTDDGQGIYREEVDNKQQTLDDAEIHYAEVGNLIIIRVKPYQEEKKRYLIYNEKLKEVRRIDAIEDACILLPDDQGLIFSNGYYLQSGQYKLFDLDLTNMLFERKVVSVNGEDYSYVFYNRQHGIFLLLNYNIIAQNVSNPIVCHGFTIFDNGEMCVFKADDEPKKHHAIQVWQTPFTGPNFKVEEKSDSFLQKIGNKEVVGAMAECQDIINLINKENIYADLYLDVIKKSTDVLDTYYWLGSEKEYDLNGPLQEIRKVAESAVDEYEKVRKIRENSQKRLVEIGKVQEQVIKKSKSSFSKITSYVELLAEIRTVRGEVISAKDLRYIDRTRLEGYDQELSQASDQVSESCVRFLMQDHALKPFVEKIQEFKNKIAVVKKVVDADELMVYGEKVADELDLLIETVSNLKITDATQTTRIIENISDIYAQYNQIKGSLSKKRKSLLSDEGKAEFGATIKLLDQSITNYLDICDTPEQCEEYLTKLIVQVEELEGKFSEFDDFIDIIAEKREEVYNAFEAKKLYLVEQRNKKSNQLYQAADRVLKAIKSKSSSLESKEEINAYFASDLMVDKVRSITAQLVEMDETVKSDDLLSQLKTIKEDVLRQLKDKQDLFHGGDNIISFGSHQFYANKLTLDLSMVVKNNTQQFHLTGTDFFESITNQQLLDLRDYWDQSLLSENEKIYRAEYLAYTIYKDLLDAKTSSEIDNSEIRNIASFIAQSEKDQLVYVQKIMATRFQEGYVKGLHEYDAHKILLHLIELAEVAGNLKFDPATRALGMFFWNSCIESIHRDSYLSQIKGASILLDVFPGTTEFDGLIKDLANEIEQVKHQLYDQTISSEYIAGFLFESLLHSEDFVISSTADELYHGFLNDLKQRKAHNQFKKSLGSADQDSKLKVRLINHWLNAYFEHQEMEEYKLQYRDEVCMLLLYDNYNAVRVRNISLHHLIEDLKGDHAVIEDGTYTLDLTSFLNRLRYYSQNVVPSFQQLQKLKKDLSSKYKDELRLHEFEPRVLSSFVRNRLIDKVYLPLIGANLAKQIGTAGESKRTDLMGLLLLISPPGYGKTTLMEYIASRLGIIFMKINGPAIGHGVTSLDPADAPNAASAEELMKLNLSFEMGNNVMIYLDDIQHCHPEFLQKFISLCDAQRKIEGVYKGKTKTYDFRGKKVCVVMAGNPYTESGDKFQIPDMLSNRADIYNLGDVIGDSEEVFKLSYIENSLTSNQFLNKLVSRSIDDVMSVIKLASTGSGEGLKFEVNHTAEELQEYSSVIRHLLQIRDVILKVNLSYIQSAAIAEENRVEPPFKLQGSYRDMNKIAEKILPMMSAEEVDVIIHTHYENEAQTLTSNAEANLLKFKQLTGKINKEEKKRWALIIEKFIQKQKLLGYGQNAQIAEGIEDIAKNLEGILGKIDESINKSKK